MDPSDELAAAIEMESERFKECYRWLQENMPPSFFREVDAKEVLLIAHTLMGFHMTGCFSQIQVENAAIVLHLKSPDADVRVLQHYRQYGIKHYRAYTSKEPAPFEGVEDRLRIAMIFFTEAVETEPLELPPDLLEEVRANIEEISDEEFNKLISSVNTRFLRSMQPERLATALKMFFRAKTRDHCQYEVRYNKESLMGSVNSDCTSSGFPIRDEREAHTWQSRAERSAQIGDSEGVQDGSCGVHHGLREEKGLPSMQIMLAWRNTPKYDVLYRLARMVHRHGLVLSRVNVTYIDPYSPKSVLIMGLGLNGASGEPAWDVADIPDFLKELVTLKYFAGFPTIVNTFVEPGLIRGNLGNLLKSMLYHVHQVLINVDPFLYTIESVEEALCRHPDLTVKILEAFEHKFHPEHASFRRYQESCDEVAALIHKLDTGHEVNDERRKNVLTQLLHMVQYTLKTNFYRNNKVAFSFRLDPHYLNVAPFDRKEKYPELPFSVFFIKGLHFIGYHVRFRDLSRGGLRTVFPRKREEMLVELNNVFNECYSLALTQQKKNKDIPEGGAKGIIFLKPYERLETESNILRHELETGDIDPEEIEQKIGNYVREQKGEYLRSTQRAYVNSLLIIINCDSNGNLRAKHIVDYYEKPEYIYLGPDERMSDRVISWIADQAKYHKYRPGGAFISGKPLVGINHKEYGVTSLGVNVYLEEVLRTLHLRDFTIKMSGGPDGDVAGNEILNLHKYFPDRAKLLAITDVSGTIVDPNGLNLEQLVELFHAVRPISYYPPQLLSEGGFLLDLATTKDVSAYAKQTLLWKKEKGEIVQEWLGASDATRLFQTNVHQIEADIFIPAGGRPRTLHAGNIQEFLTKDGNPTSKAIIEGANLYLTHDARRFLEERGALIIRDSSANKCGVICSSYEVLSGLLLSDEAFLQNKEILVQEILAILKQRAYEEARLLLDTHQKTGTYLTELSEKISKRINTFTDQLLEYLKPIQLTEPMLKPLLAYIPPSLKTSTEELPDSHKKAIIACQVAGRMVYKRGLDWFPSIVDILPVILEDPDVVG